MIVTLFFAFLGLSLILIALGLFKSEHTELALIGFLFMFLLALNFQAGTFEYKIGTNTTIEYSCFEDCNQTAVFLPSKEVNRDVYASFEGGGTLAHLVGYWLAVGAFIGFVGVLIGLRGGWKNR